MVEIMLRCITKQLHYFKHINCSFAMLNNNNNNNNNDNNNNNNNNNNNKIGFRKYQVLVNLRPIIVDLVAKMKWKVK